MIIKKIVTFHEFVEQLNKKFGQEPKEKKESNKAPSNKKKFIPRKILKNKGV